MKITIHNQSAFNRLPDAVLFDTDNTLYHYEPAHDAAMSAVIKKVTSTFSITESQFETAFDQARNEIKTRLNQQASSHSRLLYFQRMLEIMGLGSQVLLALDFEQTDTVHEVPHRHRQGKQGGQRRKQQRDPTEGDCRR